MGETRENIYSGFRFLGVLGATVFQEIMKLFEKFKISNHIKALFLPTVNHMGELYFTKTSGCKPNWIQSSYLLLTQSMPSLIKTLELFAFLLFGGISFLGGNDIKWSKLRSISNSRIKFVLLHETRE